MDISLDASESLLIDGSPFSGRRRLFHRVLHQAPGTAMVISTRQPAENARDTHCRLTDSAGNTGTTSDVSEMVGRDETTATDETGGTNNPTAPLVIDCVMSPLMQSPADDNRTKHAQHPGNLTSIGTKFTNFIANSDDESLAVGIDTVSTLLQYGDSDEMFRFLHLVVQQATAADCPVVVGIDGSAHDAQTVPKLVPIFDRVIETQQHGSDREYRVRHPLQTEWREIKTR